MASVTLQIVLKYEVEVNATDFDTLAQKAQELTKMSPEKILGRKLPTMSDWDVQIAWVAPDIDQDRY